MSIGLITSGYSNLNGLSGVYGLYGGCGYGGLYGGANLSGANAENMKQRIADNYDVLATSQSYKSKSGVESVNYTQQCSLLAEELKAGQSDQASERFEDIVDQMKNSAQYSSYSDDEIRAMIRNQYAQTTGTDIIIDVKKNTSNSFVQGLKKGVPVFGLLAQKNSEADLISQFTNSSQSKGDKVGKTVGMVTGAAASAFGMYEGGKLLVKSAKSGALKGILGKVPASKVKGGAVIAGIAAGVALIASIFGSGYDKKSLEKK